MVEAVQAAAEEAVEAAVGEGEVLRRPDLVVLEEEVNQNQEEVVMVELEQTIMALR